MMNRRSFGVNLFTGIVGMMGVSSMLACPPVHPDTVEDAAVAATTHGAKLTWNASDQKVNYRVWRAIKEAGPYTEIGNDIQSLTWTDTKVTAGTTYYYKVDCRNAQTNLLCGYSNTVKAVIP